MGASWPASLAYLVISGPVGDLFQGGQLLRLISGLLHTNTHTCTHGSFTRWGQAKNRNRERRGDKKGREAWSETDTEAEVGRRRTEKD